MNADEYYNKYVKGQVSSLEIYYKLMTVNQKYDVIAKSVPFAYFECCDWVKETMHELGMSETDALTWCLELFVDEGYKLVSYKTYFEEVA